MDSQDSSEGEIFEAEVLDGELVEQEVIEISTTELGTPVRVSGADLTRGGAPKLQTAAVAATGFVAGAATLALLRRYGVSKLQQPALEPPAPAQRPRALGWPPAQGTTFIVHVRPLQRPE